MVSFALVGLELLLRPLDAVDHCQAITCWEARRIAAAAHVPRDVVTSARARILGRWILHGIALEKIAQARARCC